MASLQNIVALLKSWDLSEQAISILAKEPEIVTDLEKARAEPPFRADYIPDVIEVLFDDVVHIRMEYGRVVLERQCDANYKPPFVEYVLDGQSGFFAVGNEIVVDRMSQIAREFIAGRRA